MHQSVDSEEKKKQVGKILQSLSQSVCTYALRLAVITRPVTHRCSKML